MGSQMYNKWFGGTIEITSYVKNYKYKLSRLDNFISDKSYDWFIHSWKNPAMIKRAQNLKL